MTIFTHMLLVGALSVGALFFLMWLIHLALKNAAIVDIGWGVGFILLCAEYILMGQGFNVRNTICLGMIILWAVRIISYLLRRFRVEKQEDKRYRKMREGFGRTAWLKFLMVFEFQAALEIVIGIPLMIISVNPNPGLSYVEMIGLIVFAMALIGETLSDEQLIAFKTNVMNKGKTCNVGLWRYSRHPNYFFEWLVWVGFFIYALGSPWGWTAIISPLLMYYLLMHVSGVPMAEEQSLLSRKDEYRKYQAGTSVFFPMPVKRSESR
jgi:steroid 5-alpha reductase family enzyme